MNTGTMKILSLLGSPRKQGNTAKVLSWVEEELRNQGHSVDRLHLVDYHLEGCIGCHYCQKNPGRLECTREDHCLEIFERMIGSDAVIYATPLYCWDFTSQMKPFIDRHLCLVTGPENPATHKSHIEGKRLALLVTAADHEGEGNSDLISEIFRRLAAYTKARVAAELIVPFCSTPDKIGAEQREWALAFAAKVAGRG